MFLKLIGGFFVCLWVADLVTGLAHWLEDTYCLEDYPLIGSFICEPNIEHHVDPQLMVREGTFFSRNVLQWTFCGLLYGALWLIGLGGIYTFTILLMASFGNEIHRWNHMSKTNGFVTFMKDSGLIQVQKQHSLHHKQPHNQYYCVMTSLLNAILERINFWRRLEWTVEILTGIAPKRENRRDTQPLRKKKRKSKPTTAANESENDWAADQGPLVDVAEKSKTDSTTPPVAPATPKMAASVATAESVKKLTAASVATLESTKLSSENSTLASTENPAKPTKTGRKFPALPILKTLKPALKATKAAACRAAAKTGCRNCSMCKLAANTG